ncbi:hypothetical protein DEU56DRAFT_832057 [Suillus clintonianus]|uniref:uncharacterized protein n=1 Tax=Suillus clintonianus TaxID=1904413 RepID=UPI001B885739|nr:uncharacterized protein DEU56DRAFT_832057 [Suillus clintonianus]KAG2122489.1 hypothetical protein DEU56DRAFT_832057 [Suillus clintonianus]
MRLLALLSCSLIQDDGELLDLFTRLSAYSGSIVFWGTLHHLRHHIALDIEQYDHPSLFHGLHVCLASLSFFFHCTIYGVLTLSWCADRILDYIYAGISQ